MLNLETRNPGARNTYKHELGMVRDWELSGALSGSLNKGGASGCRFLVKEPRWQKTRLAPEIQGGPIRGKGLRPNVCRDDKNRISRALYTATKRAENCYVAVAVGYAVRRATSDNCIMFS